jgi:hypothetical protein
MQFDAYGNAVVAPSAQPRRPIEYYAVDFLDAMEVAAKNLGYERPQQLLNHETLLGIPIIHIDITFKKGMVTTNANAKISEESGTGAPRIYAAQGFPDEILTVVHLFSSSKGRGKNAQGVQDVGKGNLDPQGGRGEVAEESTNPVSAEEEAANRQVAAAAIALIDIATVRAELRSRNEQRRYIGASSIGEDCMAYHALSLRGFPSDMPSPRLLRIFNDGHEVEAKVVKALREAGHDVIDTDDKGKQFGYVSHGGHHRAHLDGFIKLLGMEEWMTLEIKSMNAQMFKLFKKRGVKYSHPGYYDQCTDGLGLLRAEQRRLNRSNLTSKCMLVAYCKDNSDYHAEIVEFDEKRANALMDKVSTVVSGSDSRRASAYKEAYKCSDCFKKGSCWSPTLTEHKCWHCMFARPSNVGEMKEWVCSIDGHAAVTPCNRFVLFKPGAADGNKP